MPFCDRAIIRGLTGGGLIALCAGMLPLGATAQTASPNDRIDAIERQIRNLQSDLQRLKNELGEAKQQLRQSRSEAQRAKDEALQAEAAAERARQDAVRAATAQTQAAQAAAQAHATAAAPPAAAEGSAGVRVSMPGGRPTIATADGRASLAIGGFVQFDVGGYFQNPNPNTQFPRLNNGVNLRRGRVYFVGKFDDFRVNITPDFGGSPDGAPTLFEANVNYTGIKPVTATVGYVHPYVSLEDATFPGNSLFLERPSIINIERSVAAGITRASLGANAATEDYFASAYLTGPLFGAQRPTLLNGEQVGLVGRLATRPYHDEDWNLHTEFSGQMAFHPNVNANGTPGVSRTTLSLGDFPELRIDFNQLVSTGPLSARSANVYGGALGASWRNFRLQGEYYQISLNQSKLPGVPSPRLGFNGGYVEGGWVITGEPIPYDITRAAWASPKVDHPFSLEDGGIGAWVLGARYSTVDLNSNVVPGVSQSLTGGIFGGQQQIAALALSWYPNDWVRFMLQFQHVDVNKLNSAGKVQIGQRFETLAGRAQVAF
ncbi:MAG TPA: porin [Stellaceae bacterium]|nr:porin [Stellaceae bacterium]